MNFSVIVASSNPELIAAIVSRLLHPAVGFENISKVPDAIELMALINSTTPDLVIIDQELPDLTKAHIKQLIKTLPVLVISPTPHNSIFATKYSRIQVDLGGLAKSLGGYRKLAREQQHVSERGELIVVAAVASASGASSVALNLALALSDMHKVLLADFDFTHPSLMAQLNIKAARGIRQLSIVLPQTNLTSAELAEYCVKVNDSMRFLPGLVAAHQISELDLSNLDEIVAAAVDLTEVVILDLGQLLLEGPIAKAQLDLIMTANRLILVVSADPISILTSCNWLSTVGSKYSNKFEIVLNKVQRDSDRPELAKLIKEVTGALPTAYLPIESKNFLAAIWSGKPVVVANPKSKFRRAIFNWIALKEFPDILEKEKSEPKLNRLRQVS